MCEEGTELYRWGGVTGILIETYNTKQRDHRARLRRQTGSSITAAWNLKSRPAERECQKVLQQNNELGTDVLSCTLSRA